MPAINGNVCCCGDHPIKTQQFQASRPSKFLAKSPNSQLTRAEVTQSTTQTFLCCRQYKQAPHARRDWPTKTGLNYHKREKAKPKTETNDNTHREYPHLIATSTASAFFDYHIR